MTSYFKYLPESVLTKKIRKREFPFSQYLFRDTPLEKIDVVKHKNYIIERVLIHRLRYILHTRVGNYFNYPAKFFF
jgi:hypothetical protein